MEINFVPYSKITIRNYARYENPQAFADAITLSLMRGGGGRMGPMLWAHGVVFRHAPFAPSDRITEEYLKGHLPFDNLEFAPMPDFVREIQYFGFVITVLDVSNNYVLNNLGKWISENLLNIKPAKKKLSKA
jgi:hypothetical protein